VGGAAGWGPAAGAPVSARAGAAEETTGARGSARAWADDDGATTTAWRADDLGVTAAWPAEEGWGAVLRHEPAALDQVEIVYGLHRDRARCPRGTIRTGWGHPVQEAAAPLAGPGAPPAAAPRHASAAGPWHDWEPLEEVAGRRARHAPDGSSGVLTRRVAATGTVVVTSLGLAVGTWSAWVYIFLAGVGGAAAYCLTRRSLR